MSSLLPSRLLWCIAFALIVRALFWIAFVDHQSINASEYGIIARYMHEGKGYSCVTQTSEGISYRYQPNATPQPSAYMMPGYTWLMYVLFYVPLVQFQSLLLLVFQSLLACVIILLMFRWLQLRFDVGTAIAASWLYALLPENIMATSSASSVVVVQCCVVALLYLSAKKRWAQWDVALVVLSASVLIATRAESALFLFVVAFFWLRKGEWKKSLSLAFAVSIVLVPWTIRNYYALDSFIPLTTSAGLNLYRGHNPYGVGTWSDESLVQRINTLPLTSTIEQRVDSVYMAEALLVIKNDPLQEVPRAAQKLGALLFVDMNDNRATHPAYWIPSMLMFVLMLMGFWRLRVLRQSLQPELVIYLSTGVLSTLIFFCLPRYQMMLRVGVLPIASIALMWLIRRVRAHLSFRT